MKTYSGKSKPDELGDLRFIYHPSFEERGAEAEYAGADMGWDESLEFMPDEVTRRLAKSMHFAAWRAGQVSRRGAARWRRDYFDFRNRIVVGNRKLIYKAMQKWTSSNQLSDDMIGECQIVLIKATAVFNPWMGIRFSTYAFTCLLRALSRMTRRQAADRLSRSTSLDTVAFPDSNFQDPIEKDDPLLALIGDYFREESPLLTSREKQVICRRFHLNESVSQSAKNETLEEVGRNLGLSKERVRQVQKAAFLKLREALMPADPVFS